MAFPAVKYTKDSTALAGMISNSAQAGLDVSNLSGLGQLQSIVANLLVSDPSTVTVPAGDVSSGIFGSNTSGGVTSTLGFGTTPGTAAAINVDGGSYGDITFRAVHGTGDFRILTSNNAGADIGEQSTAALTLRGGAAQAWSLSGASTTSTLTAIQVTARIVGGSTNGLAIRNAANTRDNFQISDDGTAINRSDASRQGRWQSVGTLGESTAGDWIGSITSGGWSILAAPTASTGGAQVSYYDGTQRRSAAEISNVASGFGTLALMKSGGQLVFGASGTPNAAAAMTLTGAITATGANAFGALLNTSITAAANNDLLRVLAITPQITPGVLTGLTTIGLDVTAFSVAGYTTPGGPIGIRVGVLTGTGASTATALQLSPPTGATTNYLLSHTTPSTFNVTAGGNLTLAGTAQVINLNASGSVLSSASASGVGYTTGSGGVQTQGTSKVTAFTLNTITGKITFASGALAGSCTSSSATWTCSALASADVVIWQHVSGGSIGAYHVNCAASAGTGQVVITNCSSASLNEAPVFQYAIIKGAQS